MKAPLILTLTLDPVTQANLDRLRARYFPWRGYRLGAHLTLFHALPGQMLPTIDRRLRAEAAATRPFVLSFPQVIRFSQGSAFSARALPLTRLRTRLALTWWPHLRRQDRNFRGHVTVQNKVDKKVAKATFEMLRSRHVPFRATATGLDLWHYRGGPWDHAAHYDFGGTE